MIDERLLDALTQSVAQNLRLLRSRIASSLTKPREVSIIAVTKGFGPEAPLAAMRNGLLLLGENYADELVAKAVAVEESVSYRNGAVPEWHFQGRLQTNKINRLRPIVSVWQSVDSTERAEALAKRVPGASVCVQVRLADDLARPGAAPDDVVEIVDSARSAGLRVLGLMGVGPDPDLAAPFVSDKAFADLNRLCERLGLEWRSMGMSSDLEAAVRNGATHVRIGTALFGER